MRRGAAAAIVGFVFVTATGCAGTTSSTGDAIDDPSLASSDTSSAARLPVLAAAEAFVALSGDGPDEVPWARRVTYSIAGVPVSTFAPDAPVADELNACPPERTEVEGHPCPVSPLGAVAGVADKAAIETTTPEQVGCNRFVAPDVPAGLTSASIRPPANDRDCFDDFAVTLYVDGAGFVEWLDLSLSGP